MSSRSTSLVNPLVSTALLACLVVAVALACKKAKPGLSPAAAAQVEKLKPEVKLKLTQVASLESKTKSVPHTSTDEPPTTVVSPAIIDESRLANPAKSSSDAIEFHDSLLSVCKSNAEATSLKDDDVQWLERCSKLETVAVVRQRNFVRPEVDERTKTFKPGKFEGDVLVFHLPSAELRGRFALDVENDDKLELKGNPQKHEWERFAESELKTKVKSEIQAKLLESNKSARAASTK